jgi:acetyltransferase EpsM
MPEPTPILIPLLNPNEPEALLAGLHVREGQAVQPGDVLCTLETTKSAAEVSAEAAGYVIGLRFEAGQTVRSGQVLGYLADSPDSLPPEPTAPAPAAEPAQAPAGLRGGLRITQPALKLAQSLGVDLSLLPAGQLVTEAVVRSLSAAAETAPAEFDPAALVIYGGGGHAKALIDLLRLEGTYRIEGIIDDGLPAGMQIMDLPVLGGAAALAGLYRRGVRQAVNAVGGIGDIRVRKTVFQRLEDAGFTCPTVVHPRAMVEPSASLAEGVQVFPLAYVGSEAQIGFGAIINTGAIVSHECSVGAYANLSPGAILAGQVEIGAGALVGMGVTLNLRVKVGANARIGNGATVKEDVPAGAIVRAGSIWPA